MTIPRSDRVSIENRVGKVFYWKTSTSCVKLNPLSVETVDPNRIRPKIASEITSQNPSLSIVPSLISDWFATFKDCFQLTSLFFCWKETRLEIQNFITIVLSRADKDNSECKANFILKTWPARVSWGSASPWKILLFSEKKRRKPPRCTWEGHLKDRRETDIASLSYLFCD